MTKAPKPMKISTALMSRYINKFEHAAVRVGYQNMVDPDTKALLKQRYKEARSKLEQFITQAIIGAEPSCVGPKPTLGGMFISIDAHRCFKLDANGRLYLMDSSGSADNPAYIYLGKGTKLRIEDVAANLRKLSAHALEA